MNNMRKLFLLATILLVGSISALAQNAPTPPTTGLKIGDKAPDFTLTDTQGKAVKLSDFRGKTVVLAFYVLAFTGG